MAASGVLRSAVVALGAAAASAEHGLQLAAPISPQLPPTLPPYDCHAMYDLRETAWTPDWKVWCCENEARGCPSTTTTTATSSTETSTTRTTTVSSTVTATTTTTEGEGCAAMCEVDGVNNTCGDRIKWATTHEERKKKQACGAARDLVLSQCSVCGGCSLKAAGCEVEEGEEGEKDEKASEHTKEDEDGEKKHAKDDEDEKASEHAKDDDEEKKHAEKDEEGEAKEAASEPAQEKKTLRFRKKFEETAEATGPAPAAHGLGFLARCSLAGLAAGVPLAVVLRRSLRTAAAGGPELREQIYERAGVQGEDAVANE